MGSQESKHSSAKDKEIVLNKYLADQKRIIEEAKSLHEANAKKHPAGKNLDRWGCTDLDWKCKLQKGGGVPLQPQHMDLINIKPIEPPYAPQYIKDAQASAAEQQNSGDTTNYAKYVAIGAGGLLLLYIFIN
jgi:hypothetical protein